MGYSGKHVSCTHAICLFICFSGEKLLESELDGGQWLANLKCYQAFQWQIMFAVPVFVIGLWFVYARINLNYEIILLPFGKWQINDKWATTSHDIVKTIIILSEVELPNES